MFKKVIIVILGVCIGAVIGYALIFYTPLFPTQTKTNARYELSKTLGKKQVIGFLPYWLVSKTKPDYSPYITQLTYFGLTIGTDGHIQKLANKLEEEPGWHALHSESLQSQLRSAKNKNLSLSLLVFSGQEDAIMELIRAPEENARNLAADVLPIMKDTGFTDLNLDVESVTTASDSARTQFIEFVKTLKSEITKDQPITLTVDISASDLIKKKLITPRDISQFADYIVVMAYDYHYLGSAVTGPVGPLYGGGTSAEFDTNNAITEALRIIPKEKIILGVPLYGYQWETLESNSRAGVIPGTGTIMSTKNADDFLSKCSTCSAQFDEDAKELHVSYLDQQTGTYHQFFIPNEQSTQAKIDFAKQQNLGGLAFWALGYEGNTILTPLQKYK